ncbi:exported protein of unknown function [Candidatus Methylomirabilis oxygeniifera]|uniref:Uncharacterized protein n=1 Tax=Methylomirabilis oxygeniifera TaxID=671143 RepID=D5MFG0_METO1|nr:exported protein of unknown function [Candidatus Methylomirabilis oxyfera]
MGRVLALVVELSSFVCLFAVPVKAATFTPHINADVTTTQLHAQWCEQDLQDWKTRRDVVDFQIAEIDARLKDSNLTEADRKALEDQKRKFIQERTNIDWWIEWIFERLIHGACDA